MSKILIHPAYFPTVLQMVAVAQSKDVVLEVHGNYQKQTYRNRSYIAHNNGKLLLNIPIKHRKDGIRQKMQSVLIENDFPWQSHHWKSIQTAYRTSPFFEYYEDDLQPLFTKSAHSLLELNLQIFDFLCELLDLSVKVSKTETYEITPEIKDLRQLIEVKTNKGYCFDPYTQVLQAHHGFLSNLSVLDLIFNEGPASLNYLESQKITFV